MFFETSGIYTHCLEELTKKQAIVEEVKLENVVETLVEEVKQVKRKQEEVKRDALVFGNSKLYLTTVGCGLRNCYEVGQRIIDKGGVVVHSTENLNLTESRGYWIYGHNPGAMSGLARYLSENDTVYLKDSLGNTKTYKKTGTASTPILGRDEVEGEAYVYVDTVWEYISSTEYTDNLVIQYCIKRNGYEEIQVVKFRPE